MKSTKRYCTDCNKPLGGTDEKCYQCGGTKDHGPRITNERWRAIGGVY